MNVKALYSLSYGLYIVSSTENRRLNAQIANSVFQITSEPIRIAVSINKQNLTHEYIEKSGVFAVSILDQDTPMKFIGNFGFKSGRDIDKFENVNYKIGKTSSPIVLDNALGFIEAEVISKTDIGSHTIFVGEALDIDVLKEGTPMTYDYYHKVKNGLSPKTAPTYIKE